MEIKGRIKDLYKAPSRAVQLFGGHLHMPFKEGEAGAASSFGSLTENVST